MLSKKVQVLSETIQKLLQCGATENLQNLLNKAHEADIAYVFSQLDVGEQAEVLSLLKPDKQAEVVSEISLSQVALLLNRLGTAKAAALLEKMPKDDVVDILEAIPEEQSSEIVLKLKKEEADEVEDLIQYRPDTAGGIMSPNVFSLVDEMTAQEAIRAIQLGRENFETVFYLYVVNSQGHLVGVLSLKKLILASNETKLGDLMDKDPVRVHLNEDQEEVAKTVSRYNFLSLPVVDNANTLVGVITVDDVIDVIKEEAQEDMLLMTGAEKGAHIRRVPLWVRLRTRLPWFFVTLVGGLIASEVIHRYSGSAEHWVLLTGFIPLMLTMSGVIGRQSMTIIITVLEGERRSWGEVWQSLWKEFRLAVIIGLTYGCLLGIYIHLRYGIAIEVPLVVGGCLTLTMIIAVVIGTFKPILFKRAGLDPAAATGPVVTTLVHIAAIWIYFALASMVLHPSFSLPW